MLQSVRWSLCVLMVAGCYTGSKDVDEEVFASTESSDGAQSVDGMDGPASPSMPGGEDGPPSGSGDDDDDDDDADGDGDGDDDDDTPATPPEGAIVELVIPDGTGQGPWNTAESIVVMTVGQTLRVRNDDAQPHTLHTVGRPVEHGDAIQPGDSADYLVLEPYDPGEGPPETYDHDTQASVWLLALP